MDTYLQTETEEVTQNASVRSSSLLSLRRSTGALASTSLDGTPAALQQPQAATETAVDADRRSLLEDQNSSSVLERRSSGSFERPSAIPVSSVDSPELVAGTQHRSSPAFKSAFAAALAAQMQQESRTSAQTNVNFPSPAAAHEPSVGIPAPAAGTNSRRGSLSTEQALSARSDDFELLQDLLFDFEKQVFRVPYRLQGDRGNLAFI